MMVSIHCDRESDMHECEGLLGVLHSVSGFSSRDVAIHALPHNALSFLSTPISALPSLHGVFSLPAAFVSCDPAHDTLLLAHGWNFEAGHQLLQPPLLPGNLSCPTIIVRRMLAALSWLVTFALTPDGPDVASCGSSHALQSSTPNRHHQLTTLI